MMATKTGFVPEWTEFHTKRAKEFEKWYTGKEKGRHASELSTWLHDIQQ